MTSISQGVRSVLPHNSLQALQLACILRSEALISGATLAHIAAGARFVYCASSSLPNCTPLSSLP
eukprot:6180536-Pleurochrysis_carterae.AAC.1